MIETNPKMATLAERLRERISSEGPLSFHDWMEAALYDPEDGYYCSINGKQWGREGDYRTSPERSAMFAATFARYFASLYETLGRPERWTIMELGAGDGHFARGVLETLQKSFPIVFAATSYVINEVGSASRARALDRLKKFGERVAFRSLSEIEIEISVIVSNEFLDALPVHRVIWQDGRLQEFHVNVGEDEKFEWLLLDPAPELASRLNSYFQAYGVQLKEGQIAELGVAVDDWLALVAEKLQTGYLVTVDYGATAPDLYSSVERQGGTLRGFRRHEFVEDLLARPGEHDLTTTVNWSQVISTGERHGFEVVEFVRQDRFLMAAGLLEQLQIETLQLESDAERLALTTAAREMILPNGMAASFQVLVQKKVA